MSSEIMDSPERSRWASALSKVNRARAPRTIAIAIAFTAYAVWAIVFLTNPWSSWVHSEAAQGYWGLRNILSMHDWSIYGQTIFSGVGIDDNPARVRFFNNAVELFDAYARPTLVAIFDVIPTLTNASSVAYFLVCPFLAFSIARRVCGPSLVAELTAALATGAFLTSTGYISASIFVFHPAKKIIILLTLLDLLLVLEYLRKPRFWYVILVGILQFLAAATDEIGILTGLLCSILTGVLAVRSCRRAVSQIGCLAAFAAATIALFYYRYSLHWQAVAVENLPAHDETFGALILSAITASDKFSMTAAHISGAFSSLYGSPLTKWLFMFALLGALAIGIADLVSRAETPATVRQSSDTNDAIASEVALLFVAGVGMLATSALVSVLLLKFGGPYFMSAYNYYYASVLSVFAFFATCAASRLISSTSHAFARGLRLACIALQIGLVSGTTLAIAANIEDMPRLNRLFGTINTLPYAYGAINRAATQLWGTTDSQTSMAVPRCSLAAERDRLSALTSQLDMNRTVRDDVMRNLARPSTSERTIQDAVGMFLHPPPKIVPVTISGPNC